MKKKTLNTIIILSVTTLLTVGPITGLFIYGNNVHKYEETFYGELKEKTDRLHSIDEKKIIFIGGSSLAFGLRSDEIEKATGYKVVNYGLYAQIGTKPMMDLAKSSINEGDIVILAPELNPETYSMSVGYDALLKCLERMPLEAYKLSYEDRRELFYGYFPFICRKIVTKEVASEEPYTKSSFNEYGDIKMDAGINNQYTYYGYNILPTYYDENLLVVPSNDYLDDEFIEYVNKYNKYVNKKKAKMYFTFSPTNDLAIVEDNISLFESSLKEKLKCEVLGNVMDFVYDRNYFYDTNFHTNYSGSLKHSHNLAKLINEKNSYQSEYEIPVPDAPDPLFKEPEVVAEVGMFEFEANSMSGATLKSVLPEYNGVKKEDITEIVVPATVVIDDVTYEVNTIKSGAFDNCTKVRKIVLPETIGYIAGSPFTNCPNLKSIYLLAANPPNVSATGLLNGANEKCIIYVLKSAISSYMAGYAWANYRSQIASFEGDIL